MGVKPCKQYPKTRYKAGVKAVFGPGTPIPESADRTLALLEEKYLK